MPRESFFSRISKDLRSIREGNGLRKAPLEAAVNQDPKQPNADRGAQRINIHAEIQTNQDPGGAFRLSLKIQLSKSLGLDLNDPAIEELVEGIDRAPTSKLPFIGNSNDGDLFSHPVIKRSATRRDLEAKEKHGLP